MKLAMMSYSVWNQKEYYDLKLMLDLTVELGMDGIDFVTLQDEAPKTLKSMCDDRGIPIVCYTFIVDLNHPTPQTRRQAVEACKSEIESAMALAAPVVMIPTPGKSEYSPAESRRHWIDGLTEIAPIANDAGVILTIENFPDTFFTAAYVREALQAVPGLKLTFDAGNAALGQDPVESFLQTTTETVHAHFKDWYIFDAPAKGLRETLDGRFYAPALIGEGDIPHKAIIAVMKETGYDGYINVEYQGHKYDPYEAIRRAVEYLRSLSK